MDEPSPLPPRTVIAFAIASVLLAAIAVPLHPGQLEDTALGLVVTILIAWSVWRGSRVGWVVALILAVLQLGVALALMTQPVGAALQVMFPAIDAVVSLVLLAAPSSRDWIFGRAKREPAA